jgi:NYN domain
LTPPIELVCKPAYVSARTAVLIDAENVLADETNGWHVRFERLVEDLRYYWGPRAELHVFVADRAPSWMRNRVGAVAASRTRVHAVARSVDVALAAGAQLLSVVDTLVLVSCDADFLHLLRAARDAGTDSVAPFHRTLAVMATSPITTLAPADLLPTSPHGILRPRYTTMRDAAANSPACRHS